MGLIHFQPANYQFGTEALIKRIQAPSLYWGLRAGKAVRNFKMGKLNVFVTTLLAVECIIPKNTST